MIRLIIAFLIISIILINIPLFKKQKKITVSGKRLLILKKGADCKLNTLRADTCFNNKVDQCPMSSYKQCSNNNLPISVCKCNERSFELCPEYSQYSEKCMVKNHPIIKKDNTIKYPITHSRVNMYRSEKTNFDYV